MDFETFKENLVRDVKEALDARNGGDTLVETRTVDKMNETYEAITVKPEDSIIGVNLNATALYQQYGKGIDIDVITSKADAAAINGNYALEAGLPATYPALGIEEFNEETSIKRTNFLVVKEGNEESEKTKALIKALQSDKVQSYIEDTYKGAVITSYIDPQ